MTKNIIEGYFSVILHDLYFEDARFSCISKNYIKIVV